MFRFLFPRLTAEPRRGEAMFDAVTRTARAPHWYVEGQVPDTLDGRFAILATVAAFLLLRLERSGNDEASVALTERFIEVMESEHRELGLGDPTLGRTVRKLVGSLSRRVDLWREAIQADEWNRATRDSVYATVEPDSAALVHTRSHLGQFWARLQDLSDAETAEAFEDAYPSTYRPYPGVPTAITNAVIFDGEGGRIDNGTIVMAEGRVQAIGGPDTPIPDGAVRIDGQGRWVTPGVIDVHSHLGDYPSPSVNAHSDGNEATNPVRTEVWAEHSVWPQDPGFSRALANGGVTTLQVLPGSANLFGGRGVTLRAGIGDSGIHSGGRGTSGTQRNSRERRRPSRKPRTPQGDRVRQDGHAYARATGSDGRRDF